MSGLRVSAHTRQQVLQRVERLAREGRDVATFLAEAGAALDRVVPSDVDTLPSPSWVTLDPASLLVTSVVSEGCEVPIEEVMHLEYSAQSPSNRVGDVVMLPEGVQTASDLVAADPAGAPEYLDLLRSIGVEHEALVAARTREGEQWGAFYLLRGPGRPDFSGEERGFLRMVAPLLAEGIRRGLLWGEATEPEGPDAPAIVVLAEDLTPTSLTPGAQAWLADLPSGERDELPAAVLAVAQVVFADRRRDVASARVFSERRGWGMVHGQALTGDGARRVAVTIQPAGPDRITPLLIAAYGLTQREEQVTRLVLQGVSTAQIAAALSVSPYTVQEHLKHIFEKTSVRSRRELVGRVFTRHYRLRVEDNDGRVRVDRPVRGGPLTAPIEGADGDVRPGGTAR